MQLAATHEAPGDVGRLQRRSTADLAKEKGRRVRGRLKWYLSTPLPSLSLLAGASLTL
jgi:hypothetical protein